MPRVAAARASDCKGYDDIKLEMCDSLNKCCKTADLDNAGNDRENGKTDVYHNGILGSCKQVASHIMAKLIHF